MTPFVAIGPTGVPVQLEQHQEPPLRVRVALGVLHWWRPPYSYWDSEVAFSNREQGCYNAALSVVRNYLLEEDTPS